MTTAPAIIAQPSVAPLPIPTREKIGGTFNYAAVWLKRPVDYMINEAIRCIFTKIDPEVVGNAPSKYLEIARRGGVLLLCLATSAVALAILGIGIAIDALGDKLTGKSYTKLQGTAPKEHPEICRIFSGNVNMLRFDRIFGGTRPAADRIDELAKLIEYDNVDFVALQELSFANALKLWNETGMKHYFHSAFSRIGPSPTSDFDTCLFIASKVPVIREEFIPFPAADAFKRGLFYIETEKCYVMTTHLQSNDASFREKQLEIMVKKIQELEATGKPVILLMDGNIDRKEEEYQKIWRNFIDPLSSAKSETCYNGFNQDIMGGKTPETLSQSIDYVCTLAGSFAKILKMICVRAFDERHTQRTAVSDHHMFYSEVDVTGKK